MFILDYCSTYLGGTGVPDKIADLIRLAIRLFQIVVPILLILWGMLDLGKAVIAQKEDEIKKGQKTLIQRVVAAVLVFFVITITTLVINLVASDSTDITGCINDIIKGNAEPATTTN